MTITAVMKMVEVRCRRVLIVTIDNTTIVTADFALRHWRTNLFGSYLSHLVSCIVNLVSLRFLGSTNSTIWARTPAHVPPLP